MTGDEGNGPPRWDAADPHNYDIEELIQIERLMGELYRIMVQALSISPDAVLRIEMQKQRAFSAVSTMPAVNAPLPDKTVLH